MIDMLPHELLLDIFDHIRCSTPDSKSLHISVWKWRVLVHVCRRWRQIVFASPLRLNLELLCTYGTPVRKHLDCWPAFPIVVDYNSLRGLTPNDEDNIIAALEHRTRIRQIKLKVASSLCWNKIATVMREPFPALTSLTVSTWPLNVTLLLPVGFLGGCASSLREIRFQRFPSLTSPTLFLHTSNLVKLDLVDCDAHLTGCDSLAGLIVCLVLLPKLKSLSVRVSLLLTTENWQMLLPRTTRIVLPALTSLSFEGGCTYLEDFVASIDTPELDSVDITFWDSHGYRIPQLSEFLNRTALKPSRFEEAQLYFDRCDSATIDLKHGPGRPPLSIDVPLCDGINYQLWCVAEVLRQTSAMLSNVLDLEIAAGSREEGDEDMDNIYWPALLGPFTAVDTLCVYGDSEFAESIAHALEDARVLPALTLLYFKGVGVGVTAESINLPGRDSTIIDYEDLNSADSD